jgi:SCY1-like protein 1
MDFLKSAVASAISKGPAFGYTFGDRVDLNDSIWTLHNGTKRVWPGFLHAPGRAC